MIETVRGLGAFKMSMLRDVEHRKPVERCTAERYACPGRTRRRTFPAPSLSPCGLSGPASRNIEPHIEPIAKPVSTFGGGLSLRPGTGAIASARL
jgi:hypothetical protein